MSVSQDLLLAVLSMDAYNQGYGKGVDHGALDVGGTTIFKDSEEVFRDPNAGPDDITIAQAAGFYAIAYDLPGDTTVISYRGTNADSLTNLITDAFNGYWLGAGSVLDEQSRLAIQFYKAVAASKLGVSGDTITHEAQIRQHHANGALEHEA